MFNPEALSKSILEIYPEEYLLASFKSFSWQKMGPEVALRKRKDVEDICPAQGSSEEEITRFYSIVNKWGFNRYLPDPILSEPRNRKIFKRLFDTWYHIDFEERQADLIESLAAILLIPKLGIATVSKFIALANPTDAAIYDSRVTAALNSIRLEDQRIFPMVGRRQLKSKRYFFADSITTDKAKSRIMAERYLLFLKTLDTLKKNCVSFETSAQIEMALFMIGKDIERE